ncbi:hypothetical protein P168DRAFT_289633 [Aspergillus campestris IBT 28561]|uniref:Uncharacterized protein n=1 Tax=Aspergillus campestris (strain IBT 28561) TaxID=1392248 RepID=A0A2I1D4I1_ASPC2|nr:uncharacterized protein P168DRAFT_289633 [Aspergillus campestris IBT 28561]PKY04776.1 hypothetical protein P168DRAFT_289633 [Aspergillus campestris IBT 28561]
MSLHSIPPTLYPGISQGKRTGRGGESGVRALIPGTKRQRSKRNRSCVMPRTKRY